MVEESPEPLADLCLAQVCHSLDALCNTLPDGSLYLSWLPLLPQEIADQLVCKMATDGILNDRTIGIFRNSEQLRLRKVCIRSSPLSAEAFRLALCPHRLQELDASWVTGGLTGRNILASLASRTECCSGLRTLKLSGLQLDWGSPEDGAAPQIRFGSLLGLRTLNLADTDLDNAGLEDVSSLPLLESLDISGTPVTNLSALLGCGATLRSLSAHALPKLKMTPAGMFSIISRLQVLRHLDLSDDRFARPSTGDDGDGRAGDETVRQLLEGSSGVLPTLVSLDVSGRRRVTEGAVKAFVEARGGLQFLGLLATGTASCEVLSERPNLKVTGEANYGQICEALRRYSDREFFTREALIHVYNRSSELDKPRPDILKLVFEGMKKHSESLHVQLVAIACIFKLTTQDLAVGMPLRLLSGVVTQLLEAMRNFPSHEELQKKSLLVLCSDHIIKDVSFDRFEAVKLVINWLSSHEDPIEGMAVGVIFVMVDELSTEQIALLGADIFIMKQLLVLVVQKTMVGVVDSTLKFALCALCNLTEGAEGGTASRQFIQCQGLELYEEVLKSYSESSVLQKALALLNNIAAVEELRGDLMKEELLEHVLVLLQGAQVEVSYFAGGILAHLTSREAAWTLDKEFRTNILERLHAAILRLMPTEHVLVLGDRSSIHPVLSLLQPSQPAGVQLWAMWALKLVCSQNIAKNCRMLVTEGGKDLLQALTSHPDTHSDVTALAECILDFLHTAMLQPWQSAS